ncbi:MAG TPA: hypothetical protein VFV95_08550 [Vicinamibacterales bacterium]|nr:hypothetical protein [Vicinamibacterales bacterium]
MSIRGTALSPLVRRRIERWLLVLTIGAVAARITLIESEVRPRPSDFGQVWAAARFLLEGINPYDAIGPQGLFRFSFPFLYPLTAAVATLPLAPLPANIADAVFMALGSALLAWALTRETTRNPQMLVFASVAFLANLGNAQWSPLITAAGLLPGLGFLLACKPTLGLAFLAAYPSWRSIAAAGLFTLITVAIWPWWPAAWLQVLTLQTHPPPVMQWGGPLMLLGLLKWRRPEARLLVGLACVPHTVTLYEVIPLFLVVQTWTEGVVLALLTPVVWYLQEFTGGPYPTVEAWYLAGAHWQLLFIYFPCLLMVLRRPNVGASIDAAALRSWLPRPLRAWSSPDGALLSRVRRVKTGVVGRDEDRA